MHLIQSHKNSFLPTLPLSFFRMIVIFKGLYAQEVAQSYRTSLVVAKEMLLTAGNPNRTPNPPFFLGFLECEYLMKK